MKWLVSWIDEQNRSRESEFYYSTEATRFVAMLLEDFPDCLVRLETLVDLDDKYDPYGDSRDTHTSRDGNWPASIGNSGGVTRKDEMKA